MNLLLTNIEHPETIVPEPARTPDMRHVTALRKPDKRDHAAEWRPGERHRFTGAWSGESPAAVNITVGRTGYSV